MDNFSKILSNSSIMSNNYTSLDISLNEISNIEPLNTSTLSFDRVIDQIKQVFKISIKSLRANFSIDSYEKSAREIRNHIIQLRKMYYMPPDKNSEKKIPKTQSQNQNQNYTNTQTQTQTHTHTNVIPNIISNTNTENTNSNTNINPNKQTGINLENNSSRKRMDYTLNESSLSQSGVFIDLKNAKSITIIYNVMLEIAYFLMSYDDIYINYENKSAYVTMKLFLQMASLHFIKNIFKQDFILCLMNKSCNILCEYNEMSKKDPTIRKMLALEVKELEKFNKLFNYDINVIKVIINKINNNEIKKIDLVYKGEKIKENIDSNKLFNNMQREIKENIKDEIQLKFDKLNEEINILNDIQNNIGEKYKIFLKDPLKNEIEQFTILFNKISEFETPLIKQIFLDIILRNKEVFNYINENILIPHIPKVEIKKLNLYPFNKSLSIYADKYIKTGKAIIEVLSIPLEQNYLKIKKRANKFAEDFLNSLSKFGENNEEEEKEEKGETDDKNGENNENSELFTYEINNYHLILFSFMVTSKMKKDKIYFNRISALIKTEKTIDELKDILDNIEGIKNVEYNSRKDKDNDKRSIILFDYENINKNNISFLLEKKYEEKKEKKKKKKI